MHDVHAVTRLCHASVQDALALLSQASGLACWNLGLWHTQDAPGGLLQGRSLFDGALGLAQVVVHAGHGLVEYRVGSTATALVPRIQARVQPGPELGFEPGHCLVTLLAWRSAGMSDERWQRLCAVHEVEIELIRAQLEAMPGADS